MSLLRNAILEDFAPRKVGISEFCESDEFCGKRLYPFQRLLLKLIFLEELEGWEEDLLDFWIRGGRNGEIQLSPEIRDRIQFCRDSGFEHFSEVNFIGGRRSSKGFVTGLAGTYKLFKVQQIPDPGAHYNIDLDKEIYFTCVAASLDQAKKFQFADLYSSITRCVALAPNIAKAQEESISIKTKADSKNIKRMEDLGLKIGRDFSKLRVRPLAANADTLRGATSIFMCFDEMAFMMPGESNQSAAAVYAAAEPSLAQFGPAALLFCNSSPYTKIGQFYEQTEQAMRSSDHEKGWFPMRFAIKFPSWALYDMWWKDPERRFQNAIMVSPDWPDQLDPNEPASKLDELSLGKRHHEQLQEQSNPDTYKVERRANWAEVLDAYLNPEMVDRAYNGVLPDGRPWRRTHEGTYLYDYKMHCDPSSTTAGFGFAIAHVEEFPDDTGLFPGGVQRHVIFDLVKRWNPASMGGTINYLQVQSDLAGFVDLYRPSELTFDQFNSTGLIQGLRENVRQKKIHGISIHEITATNKVNHDRWEVFKTALNLGLVHIAPDCYEYSDSPDGSTGENYSEYSAWELKFLREIITATTKRVDKQDEGPIQTKDIADCIAEVTNKFLASFVADFKMSAFGQQIATGSEGGYQMGGRTPGGPMQNPGSSVSGADRFGGFYSRTPVGANARARGIDPNRRRY